MSSNVTQMLCHSGRTGWVELHEPCCIRDGYIMAHAIQPIQVASILRVTLKRKPVEASYTISGQTLEKVDSAKLLGVWTLTLN